MIEEKYPGAKVVYVVMQGEYSDTRIAGVYSTRALAEQKVRCLEEVSNWSDPRIDEWFLDYPEEESYPPKYKRFVISMQADGTVVATSQMLEACATAFSREPYPYLHHSRGALSFNVMAKDLNHAIKIVNERRAKMVALNQWPVEKLYPQ